MRRLARICFVSLMIWMLLCGQHLPHTSKAAGHGENTQRTGTRKALLIGINKYESRRFPSLPFPLNDVARLAELLESPNYRFDVTKLTDETPEKPTRDNILNAIRKLIDDSQAGDVAVFYFSGHGSSVRNSLSDEPDLRDETIVPMDAVRPVTSASALKDIRDKELAEVFNRALDKKVTLTAIFDSCHSGSIARGDERPKEGDAVDFDIKTAPTEVQKVKPENRGALIVTAAEDYQQASGGEYELNGKTAAYSHFTAELLQSLYEDPADQVSSTDLFRRIVAGVKAAGRSQTPTIAGTMERAEKTIFGSPAMGTTGRARVPATIKEEHRVKRMMLAGGLADGLADGVELRRINPGSGKETEPGVKIRITKAGLTLSEFEVLRDGGPASAPASSDGIKERDIFEQTTWVTRKEPDLRVWIPPAVLSETALKEEAARLQTARTSGSMKFVSEPAADPSLSVVFAEAVTGKQEWKINLPTGAVERLPADPTGENILQSLARNNLDKNGKIFINLPPSVEMRKAMESGMREIGINLSEKRASADYELVGRLNAESGVIEYAWFLRSSLENENQKVKAALKQDAVPRVSMPPITDWVRASPIELATGELKTLALRLGKLSGWLNLPSPITIGSREFPYRLEVRERGSARAEPLKAGAVLFEGREYDLVLRADPSNLKGNVGLVTKFWVYVIGIDRNGNGGYMSYSGVTEKYGGLGEKFDDENRPTEIPLTHVDGPALTVSEPFGLETFIMLVTDREIPRTLLNLAGVRDQNAATRKGGFNPLTKLLEELGVDTRSKSGFSSPDSWAVQQLVMVSAARPGM